MVRYFMLFWKHNIFVKHFLGFSRLRFKIYGYSFSYIIFLYHISFCVMVKVNETDSNFHKIQFLYQNLLLDRVPLSESRVGLDTSTRLRPLRYSLECMHWVKWSCWSCLLVFCHNNPRLEWHFLIFALLLVTLL